MSPVLATRVKQIAAGLLDVGYVDVGPPDGPAVVLLHGWPYDIHTFAEVWPPLAAAGARSSVARHGMRFLPRPVRRPGVPVWVAGFYGRPRPLHRAAPRGDPAPYAAAGATWWVVDFPGDAASVDLVRGVIRDGPFGQGEATRSAG